MNATLPTLTEMELEGLRSEANMADGHAYHDLSLTQMRIVESLPEIWRVSAAKKHRRAEGDFRDAFASLAASPSLRSYPHFRICPTASNSIDILAAWLRETGQRVALIEPTFDNLALILRRRGVALNAIPEWAPLEGEGVPDFDAIFVVNPNNPTGATLTRAEFRGLVDFCARRHKTLLLDNTFRFFVAQDYDMYGILLESGVTFVSIEDTGKVWPTQDLKARLLFFSENIAAAMNVIYEEIYLCVSNFQLELLGAFLKDAKRRGLADAVWDPLMARRNAFRRAIAGTALAIEAGSVKSQISVEWVEIKSPCLDDLEMTRHLKSEGLAVLPGRHFYWNLTGRAPTNRLRFSLLKSAAQFGESLRVLTRALEKL